VTGPAEFPGDAAHAIRSNFENLVRASPLPRVVRERLSASPQGRGAGTSPRGGAAAAALGVLPGPAASPGSWRASPQGGSASPGRPSPRPAQAWGPPPRLLRQEEGGPAAAAEAPGEAPAGPSPASAPALPTSSQPPPPPRFDNAPPEKPGSGGPRRTEGRGEGRGGGRGGGRRAVPRKGREGGDASGPGLQKRRGPGRPRKVRSEVEEAPSAGRSKKPAASPRAAATVAPEPVALIRAEDDQRVRTTRSGRQVFPKLEFWRNEAIARDTDTGAVIGTFRGKAGAAVGAPPGAAGKATAGRPRKAAKAERRQLTEDAENVAAAQKQSDSPSDASPRRPPAGLKRLRAVGGGSGGEKPGSSPGTATGGGGMWTEEQVLMLQEAQVVVDPGVKNYWQRVAARVPGKLADECYEKLFEAHPTPPREARGAVARHYLEGEGGGGGGQRRQKLTKARARKKVRAARWQMRREVQAIDAAGVENGGDVSGSEGEEDEEGAEEFFQTVEAQAIADQYIDKFKRQQAQHSRAARGRERAGARGVKGGMDAMLGAGPADGLAAAIRNAIACVQPQAGGHPAESDADEVGLGEDEEGEEEEAAPRILFGEGA